MGMDEECCPIKDFEDYLIYKDGRVFSKKSNIFLKPIIGTGGYCQINLYNESGHKIFLIHRLVAMAFLKNPYNLPEVDHIDCDKQNNDITNLRWISSEDNLRRSYDLKHQTNNRTPIRQLTLEGEIIAEYESQAEAFRRTSIRHINEVLKGIRKTAGGYKWEYLERKG